MGWAVYAGTVLQAGFDFGRNTIALPTKRMWLLPYVVGVADSP